MVTGNHILLSWSWVIIYNYCINLYNGYNIPHQPFFFLTIFPHSMVVMIFPPSSHGFSHGFSHDLQVWRSGRPPSSWPSGSRGTGTPGTLWAWQPQGPSRPGKSQGSVGKCWKKWWKKCGESVGY